ncbi:two-component sensor histidine kinase [Clostridia bacterium]|nr:two-component sensor histidine kinase [Clostridia bacterium]
MKGGLKFWQKAFFCALALFLIASYVLGYVVFKQSFSLNEKYIQDSAAVEQQIIVKSLYENVRILSDKYGEPNKDNIQSMVEAYAEYYSEQGVYLTLSLDNEVIFSNAPENLPFFTIAENLAKPFGNVQFMYKKDVSGIMEWHSEMLTMLIMTSVIVSACMSAALLFMLLRLTSPFRKLNLAAAEIKNGNYEKRVDLGSLSKDEIGEFAEAFNTMADSVQANSESRERFINNLAHEMRTPITSIAGYAELLKIANIEESARVKAVDYILSQSLRMKNMVYKLMDLAYMKNSEIEKLPLDIGEIISRAADTLDLVCRDGGIRVIFDFNETADIRGDAALIESLVQNLLENAIKAGGTQICVYTERKAIIIEDNGKGMETEEIRKITEPFYRIDKARARAGGGVGLGLALCAEICDIHGAKLNITSKKGSGTRIKIDFTTI